MKKLIEGLLNKGGDKASNEGQMVEVPDELPPLVEDTLEKEIVADSAKAVSEDGREVVSDFKELEKEAKNSVAEEQKGIDTQGLRKETAKAEESYFSEKPKSFDSILDELKQEPTTKQEENEEFSLLSAKKSDHSPHEPSFFSELLAIMEQQGIKDKVLQQDLFKKMKDFWYFHPHGKGKIKDKEQLEKAIYDELTHLKKLEERWVAQRKFIEEDRRALAEKGREIRARIEDLQLVVKQLKLYEDVSQDKQFVMKNRVVVKNVYELMNVLEFTDDATFLHHVHEGVNHFSDWVRDVIGHELLAEKLKKAKKREEIINILENEIMGNVDAIDPEKYFRLNNGRVVKDISSLVMALSEIDDITFKSHCTLERNDFSAWIRDVFKNDYLAEMVAKAKTKEEMVQILKDF